MLSKMTAVDVAIFETVGDSVAAVVATVGYVGSSETEDREQTSDVAAAAAAAVVDGRDVVRDGGKAIFGLCSHWSYLDSFYYCTYCCAPAAVAVATGDWQNDVVLEN